MEQIRKAVELARGGAAAIDRQQGGMASHWPRQQTAWDAHHADVTETQLSEQIKAVELNRVHLESKRIVSHDGADPRAKAIDMLRTQVLQSMDANGSQILAITSPTAGCGKTLTAINLALSIARQPERSVLLVDMDLTKPQVANCLGLRADEGIISVLEGHTALASAMIHAHIGRQRLMVLPTGRSTANSAEWMTSRSMGKMLQDIRTNYRSRIVILDMPPMLSSDDVIAILPQIDSVLLVVAVGTSTASEIEECNRHLHSTDVVRIVLNKVPEASARYY